MLEKIMFNEDFVLKKMVTSDECNFYLLNRTNGDSYEINEVAYNIISKIKEGKTGKKIFLELSKIYDCLDYDSFVTDYAELVDVGKNFGALIPDNVGRFLKAPYEYLVLHACKYIDGLNRKCDHDCVFCFENVDEKKSNKILPSFNMIKEVLSEIHSHNKRFNVNKFDRVYIAGGEPTLRDDIFDIIKLVSSVSNKIYLSTHGDYEDPNKVISVLKDAGLSNISISLHGPIGEVHEEHTRTKGSFNNTINTIRACLENKIGVSLNYVVTALNVNHITAMLKMLKEKCSGIDEITFTHYRHSGEACENLSLDFDAFSVVDFVKQAIEFSSEVPFVVNFRDFPLCLDERLAGLDLDVAPYYVVIWDDRNPNIYNLYSEKSGETFLPKCKACSLKQKCNGVLTSNLNKYNKYTDWAKLDEYQKAK